MSNQMRQKKAHVQTAAAKVIARAIRLALPKLQRELQRPTETVSLVVKLTTSLLLLLRSLTILQKGEQAENEQALTGGEKDQRDATVRKTNPESALKPLRNSSHEAFAVAFAEGASAAEAYAHAYGRPRDATARANSCRLLSDARVNARIQHLRAPIAEHGHGVLVRVLDALGADAERQIASGDLRACKRTVRRIVEIVEIAQGC